jgi:hypothetical protein
MRRLAICFIPVILEELLLQEKVVETTKQRGGRSEKTHRPKHVYSGNQLHLLIDATSARG